MTACSNASHRRVCATPRGKSCYCVAISPRVSVPQVADPPAEVERLRMEIGSLKRELATESAR